MRDHLDDVAMQPARLISAPTERSSATPQQAAVLRLQREAGNEAVSSLMEEERSPVLDVVGSGGSALPAETRDGMEARFGADFSGVRVHTGDAAAESAQSVQARAYTVGDDVVLGSGIDPASAAGEKTLAHELTHVLQQRAGDVDGTPTGGGIRVSDPGDRFEQEAEHTAERVMSSELPAPSTHTPTGAGVQREEMPDEDEEVQTLRLQRQGEDEVPEEELPG